MIALPFDFENVYLAIAYFSKKNFEPKMAKWYL